MTSVHALAMGHLLNKSEGMNLALLLIFCVVLLSAGISNPKIFSLVG